MVQAMLPSKVLEIDALRLLLRPFWDRSTPVVASYMAGQVLHPIHCSVHAFAEHNARLFGSYSNAMTPKDHVIYNICTSTRRS